MKNINTPEYWDETYKVDYERKSWRYDLIRYRLICNEIQDGHSVLDFGCGMGDFFIYLKKIKPHCKLYGIDFSKFALEIANKRVRGLNLFENLDQLAPEIKFDRIIAQHILEHVTDPDSLIKSLIAKLNPGGVLVIVLPINDREWKEHLKIYQIGDMIKLTTNLGHKFYKFIHRATEHVYEDGAHGEEGIAFIGF